MISRTVSLISFFAVVLACAAPAAGGPPEDVSAPGPTPAVIAPGRQGLAAVPLPRMERLDPAVAGQLERVQGDVAAVVADPQAVDADVMDAYGLLGQLYHGYGLLDAAATCYRNANLLAPQDYRWLHLLGVVLKSLGSSEEALRSHELALAEKPGDVISLIEIGELCLELSCPEVTAQVDL